MREVQFWSRKLAMWVEFIWFRPESGNRRTDGRTDGWTDERYQVAVDNDILKFEYRGGKQ